MAGMVIIGAGHAAGQAAASLRQEKYTGPITIIGDEAHLPYQRPPLSKAYLSGSFIRKKKSICNCLLEQQQLTQMLKPLNWQTAAKSTTTNC